MQVAMDMNARCLVSERCVSGIEYINPSLGWRLIERTRGKTEVVLVGVADPIAV